MPGSVLTVGARSRADVVLAPGTLTLPAGTASGFGLTDARRHQGVTHSL